MRSHSTHWRCLRWVALLVGELAGPACGGPSSDASPNDTAAVGALITWDAATKTATIPIVAGLTSSYDGWNFNSYARRETRIVVPVGTKVVRQFYNENVVPHSAMIVAGSETAIPPAPTTPAFRGATTHNPGDGLVGGRIDQVRFTAAKAGKYLLVCGIPGYAQSGMWDWFENLGDREGAERQHIQQVDS